MKKIFTILATILSIGGCKQFDTQNDDFIIVDITKNYPKKELILQDFMNVEYVPLETNDDFLCQGLVQAIGKDIILITNRVNDGNIFIFDRNGKGVKKINCLGQGGEEYTTIIRIILDESNGEIFVKDYYERFLVYDLNGKFKRSFKLNQDAYYNTIYNFDSKSLICYDGNDEIENREPFTIISKQEGSPSKKIEVSFKEKKSIWLKVEANDRVYFSGPSSHHPIIPYLDSWILTEPSSDTIYQYSPAHIIIPFIVRTPSVQSMDPEVFLFPSILTDRYYFMQTVKKVWDFETQSGLPSTDLIYDKQENAIFRYTIYNDDYSNKKDVLMSSTPINDEIAFLQRLEAHDLVEAYENGQLKGKLKEIAATLDEESNPVIMLVKHKK